MGDWTGSDPAGGTARSRSKRTHAHGGVKETPADGFTLLVEDENGDLQTAGALTEPPAFDYGDGWGDWGGDGSGDWNSDWGNAVVIVIFMPTDGSFDLEAFLDKLFGGADPTNGMMDMMGGMDTTKSGRHR
jgi:hypothetical protein